MVKLSCIYPSMQTTDFITAELSRRKLTQAALAERIGVHYSTVSLILNGKRQPSIKTAESLSEFIGCTLEDAFPDVHEKKMKLEAIRKRKSARMVNPQEIKNLRKEVKKLMIDLDMDRRGFLTELAERISTCFGRRISRNSLSMALTGYRAMASSHQILETARDILSSELKRC